MKISDFKENMLEDILLMVLSVEEKMTTKQKPYVDATLTDGEKRINVKFWDMTKDGFVSKFPVGTVMNIPLESKLYQGILSFTAKNGYGKAVDGTYNMEEFIPTVPMNPHAIFDECEKIINELAEPYKTATLTVFSQHKKELVLWSAAKAVHHNLRGGLLWHVYRMTVLAKELNDVFISAPMDLDKYEEYYNKLKTEIPLSAEAIGNAIAKRNPQNKNVSALLSNIGGCYADIVNYLVMEMTGFNKDTVPNDCFIEPESLYRALLMTEKVCKVYNILDCDLIKAAIVLLSLRTQTGSRNYSTEIIYGHRLSLVKMVPNSNLEDNEKTICLKAMLLSVDMPDEKGIHTQNIPEAFVASEIFEMARYSYINKQFVISAALLHDIGKLTELNTDFFGVAEYSVEGILLGHMVTGIELLEKDFENKIPEKLALMYYHVIASHHKNIEWGALCKPAFPEADLIHILDMIDSRIYQYEELLKEIEEPGTFSNKRYSLGNTTVYKKK